MKIPKSIDISGNLSRARALLAPEKTIDADSLKSVMSMLVTIIELLLSIMGANSKNSSVSPSQDPNRPKPPKVGKSDKKPGGQPGRKGVTLTQVPEPNEIVEVNVDLGQLAPGPFKELPREKRQVFDIQMNVHVTEYHVQVIRDAKGHIHKANCPVEGAVQYGSSVRGLACYLSNFQLVPVERIVDFFEHQIGLPLSAGTVVNINTEAAAALCEFERTAKQELIASPVLHADETGINLSGKNAWLHSASTQSWSLFCPSLKRGAEAIEHIGIIPQYRGVLVHDHWASYFKYSCIHAVCGAHLVRELTRVVEQSQNSWAKDMIEHLYLMKTEVEAVPERKLSPEEIQALGKKYDEIIALGEAQNPISAAVNGDPPKRGRIKKSKERNLLERMRDKRSATLRYMEFGDAPFTNNQAERDIRMTKVHQKISGCYKTLETAKAACLIRSFISTCQKQGFCIYTALSDLFVGKLPSFKLVSIPPL